MNTRGGNGQRQTLSMVLKLTAHHKRQSLPRYPPISGLGLGGLGLESILFLFISLPCDNSCPAIFLVSSSIFPAPAFSCLYLFSPQQHLVKIIISLLFCQLCSAAERLVKEKESVNGLYSYSACLVLSTTQSDWKYKYGHIYTFIQRFYTQSIFHHTSFIHRQVSCHAKCRVKCLDGPGISASVAMVTLVESRIVAFQNVRDKSHRFSETELKWFTLLVIT